MIIPMLRALVVLLALPVFAAPRPIHDAEREAVGIAAQFLANGPEAIWTRLAPDSPLRTLPRNDALREIAARTGPRQGATWTLQTSEGDRDAAFHVNWASGYDDGLLFRMKRRGSQWMLQDITTLAELPSRPRAAATAQRPELRVPLVVFCAILVFAAAILRERRMLSIMLFASAAACGLVAMMPFLHRAANPPPVSFVELRDLSAFRSALAQDREPRVPNSLTKEARDVATLWSLQSGMAMDVGGTKSDPIAELSSVSSTPLADVIRARLALSSSRDAEAMQAFERASSLRPVRDDILHEAALSFGDDRARAFIDRMRLLGTREADIYYRDAASLRTAWTLEPKPREELVRKGLVDDVAAKALVSYYSAAEPVHRSAALASRALQWPSGAKAFVCGEHLRVEMGDAVMDIANGAALAPPDAQVVAATHGEQQRDAAALHDAQEMLEHGAAPSRVRMIRAAIALSRHNRWADVLKITDHITPQTASVPADLLILRMRALLRARRVEDARALADGNAARKLQDAGAVVALADAMSNAGEWSTAESLFRSVRDRKYIEPVALRLKQIELRRALAANAQTVATAHFDIRHDASINPAIAMRIGDLLEAELARLQKTLPKIELRRVAVNVLRWEDFSEGITKSDHILGLYDGEILFPFASVEQFKPEIVAIITHELTHAILAQATNDNAPRWYQEGVASRMELRSQENAFRDTPPNIVLPVTLLDAVMEKNTDPSAYVVAQTFIHFLEDRYGADAIAKLAGEFARGTNTDDALVRVAGKSLDAINADFRSWGFQHNGDFAMTEAWPYAHWYSPDVDPRIKAGFKFGH